MPTTEPYFCLVQHCGFAPQHRLITQTREEVMQWRPSSFGLTHIFQLLLVFRENVSGKHMVCVNHFNHSLYFIDS